MASTLNVASSSQRLLRFLVLPFRSARTTPSSRISLVQTPGKFPGLRFNEADDDVKGRIKDAIRDFQLVTTHLPFIDYARLIRRLRELNYQGVLVFEIGGRPELMPGYLADAKRKLEGFLRK